MKRFSVFFKIMFTASLLIFASCSGLMAPQSDDFNSQDGTAKLKIDLQDNARTALPEFDMNSLTYITLNYSSESDDDDFGVVGSWTSVQEMRNSVLPFKTGNYKFTLIAVTNSAMFSENKSYTIVNGTNSLSFTPHLSALGNMDTGSGNLNVKVSYNTDNVAKVTAGLYSTAETKIPGYNDEDIAIQSGGRSEYTKNNVPSGNYIVIFKFYADSNKTKLLGTYREYASIINGLTSKSDCVIESLGNLFSITYNLNGGSFTNGFTAPGSYTRHMDTIILPTASNISRAGYTFAGWYQDADFNGSAETVIFNGNSGNKTYYAKWIPEVSVIFVANGGKITTTVQSATRGTPFNLKTAAELGLSGENGRQFLGWATKGNAREEEYTDGASITLNENIVLYAIWTISSITSASNADSDKDGLTDAQEINIYKTDPTNPDTDGDGWNDGREAQLYSSNTNTFNPLIADTPALEVKFVGNPQISYKYTTSSGGSVSESVTTNTGETGSSSATNSNTKSRNETHGWNVSVNLTAKFGASKGFMELSTGGSLGYSGSVNKGDSYTYSRQSSSGWSKSWTNGKTTSSNTSKSVTGGQVVFSCQFKNPSNIAYNVKSVTVSLNRIPNNTKEAILPVGSETLTTVGTLAPGATSGTFNITSNLDLGTTEELLKWSTGMDLQVSGYTIALNGNDFTESLTTVKAQTAALYIDWGNESRREPVTYNIAVKNRYNPLATVAEDKYLPTDLKYVFDEILNLREGVNYTLGGEEGKKYLNSIYEVQNSPNGADQGVWFIGHKYTDPTTNRRMGAAYYPFNSEATDDQKWNLSDIKINPGDEISIIYSVDKDKDGVPANEELIHGTSDDDNDKDDDGLTDYEEIYGWYKSDIGLAGTYSQNNKVYTSPILKDTDGDGDLDDNGESINMFDFSSDENLRDPDPVNPRERSDTSLRMSKFATSSTGDFADLTFDSNGNVTLNDIKERIYLDIVPKLAFARVQYKTDRNTSFTDFDKYTPIELNVGVNTITVRCTAPDTYSTYKDYVITVNSDFNSLSNFSVSSRMLGGGLTSFTWTSYADERASASDGGYILYGKKATSLTPPVLTRDNALNPTDITTGLENRGEFYWKIDPENLARGFASLNLQPHTDYCFVLYAYAHSGNNATFKYKNLGAGSVKTGRTEIGKLNFYANYIEATKDQDGGCDPQYYWSFSGGELDLSSLNISESEKKEFDDDDDKYFCFGEQKTHKIHQDPDSGKNSSCTQKITAEFSRAKNHHFTIRWNATEYDKGSGDDYLGCVTATFDYNASTDTWTCSWYATGDGVTNANAASSSITSGQSSMNLLWKLFNVDEGEIQMCWGWGWDD